MPRVSKSQNLFRIEFKFSVLENWSIFNITCEFSLTKLRLEMVLEIVTGPFNNQPNLVSTQTGSPTSPILTLPVTMDQ